MSKKDRPIVYARFRMTPEIAAKILEKNTNNRRVRPAAVAGYSRDMANGLFQYNGDAIRIATDDTLLDGQHRLLACLDSGASFDTILIEGLPPATRMTIDSGVKRTVGDRFMMAGRENANALARTCRLLALFATGNMHLQITASETEAIRLMHPNVEGSVSRFRNSFPKVGTIVSAVHYIGTYAGFEERADAYGEVWKSGLPDYRHCAAHRLRERVVLAQSSRRSHDKMDTRYLYTLFANSWDRFIDRQETHVLRPREEISFRGWSAADLGIDLP